MAVCASVSLYTRAGVVVLNWPSVTDNVNVYTLCVRSARFTYEHLHYRVGTVRCLCYLRNQRASVSVDSELARIVPCIVDNAVS